MSGMSREGAIARVWRHMRLGLSVVATGLLVAACTTQLGGGTAPLAGEPAAAAQATDGQVRIALILPLTAQGNAGLAAQSMKNAAEMALAEFKVSNVQLLVKDDGGSPQGAQSAAQQAISEGAEIIVGPLFAQSVSAAGQVARSRNIPVIAFSTDASVAARGVYLLSFLPETDVRRIVSYAASRGKRSFAALMPDNAYGTVVEAAFQQEVARHGGRVVVLEKYPHDANRTAEAVRRVAQAAGQIDCIFLPDSPDAMPQVAQALAANGVDLKHVQLLGTGLWGDDTRISSEKLLDGGWYPRPSRPDSVTSRAGTALVTDRIQCARQRSRMTWSRWWQLSSKRRGCNASASRSSRIRPGSQASMVFSASAPRERASADLRFCA